MCNVWVYLRRHTRKENVFADIEVRSTCFPDKNCCLSCPHPTLWQRVLVHLRWARKTLAHLPHEMPSPYPVNVMHGCQFPTVQYWKEKAFADWGVLRISCLGTQNLGQGLLADLCRASGMSARETCLRLVCQSKTGNYLLKTEVNGRSRAVRRSKQGK